MSKVRILYCKTSRTIKVVRFHSPRTKQGQRWVLRGRDNDDSHLSSFIDISDFPNIDLQMPDFISESHAEYSVLSSDEF